MREVIPGITVSNQTDLDEYAMSVERRFSNVSIRYKTTQVANDGSQKLPQRLLEPLAENLSQGRQAEVLTLAVAGWMAYIGGYHHEGKSPALLDPIAGELLNLRGLYRQEPKRLAHELLQIKAVFPSALRENTWFTARVGQRLETLANRGALIVVRDLLDELM